ncbi:flavodoxin [Pedobacter sp. MC2016-15]|uniref:flavodoxin n=1 Tax=Pedobacter sp. MC2016-15 TaxID=2994473 RepID=UPI002245F157|nr:flavodoxin [Pedobacter sp. MC2016-15]MCX2479433.1 flavodoxin [Pedobacter sp. MC2016-15]
MKYLITLSFLIVLSSALFAACSKSKSNTSAIKDQLAETNDSLINKKVLIVYLSRTNNTKAVAQIIHKKVGGDMVALELVNPYPQDYKKIVDQVSNENSTGFLPPLKTKIDKISQYDTIFLGFPTWGMQLPPPMKSFLKQYDLSGKTIIPFNTNAGYGIGNTFQTVKETAPKSTVLEGFSTKGGIERDGVMFVMEGNKEREVAVQVETWLRKLKMIP